MDDEVRPRPGLPADRLSVLVVGGSRGIGLATSMALRGAGHRVAAWSRSGKPETANPAEAQEISFASVDVRCPQSVAAEFGRAAAAGHRPDALVYCAATVGRGAVGSVAPQLWREAVEINAIGAYTVIEQYVRVFGRHPSRVVGLTSEAALFPAAERSAYAASKAALGTFLDAYRAEARPSGTLVTVLYLGKVNTTLSRRPASGNARALQPADVAGVLTGLFELAPHVEVRSIEVASVRSVYG